MAMIFTIVIVIVAADAYKELKIPRNLVLRISMKSSVDSIAKVYFDMGGGYGEKDSTSHKVDGGKGFQILYFALPRKRVYRLRFDPLNKSGEFSIKKIELFDDSQHIIQPIALHAFTPMNQIAEFDNDNNRIAAKTESNARDPILNLQLDYPLSLNSVYPIKNRVLDIFARNSNHVSRVFFTVFFITCVAMHLAYLEATGMNSVCDNKE